MLAEVDDDGSDGEVSVLSLVALSKESSADFFLEICNISFMTRFISSSKLSSFFESRGTASTFIALDVTTPLLGITKTSSLTLLSLAAVTTETDFVPESNDALFIKVFSSSLERSMMLTEDEAVVGVFLSDSSLSLSAPSSLPCPSRFSDACSPSSPVVLGAPSLIFSTDLMLKTPLEAASLSSGCCFPGVTTASLCSADMLFLLDGSPLGLVVRVEVVRVVGELLGRTVALSEGLGGCGVVLPTLPPPKDTCFLTGTDRL